jgi:hypothetical protein
MTVDGLDRHGPWTHAGRHFHIDAVNKRDLSLQRVLDKSQMKAAQMSSVSELTDPGVLTHKHHPCKCV